MGVQGRRRSPIEVGMDGTIQEEIDPRPRTVVVRDPV